MSGGYNEKIVLTAEQEAWLVKHFRNTKNDVIMKKLCLSNLPLIQ